MWMVLFVTLSPWRNSWGNQMWSNITVHRAQNNCQVVTMWLQCNCQVVTISLQKQVTFPLKSVFTHLSHRAQLIHHGAGVCDKWHIWTVLSVSAWHSWTSVWIILVQCLSWLPKTFEIEEFWSVNRRQENISIISNKSLNRIWVFSLLELEGNILIQYC